MTTQKCPNCAGEMVLSADKRKYVCMYCDSEILVNSSSESDAPQEENLASKEDNSEQELSPVEKLFCFSENLGELTAKSALNTLKLLLTCINRQFSTENYKEFFERMAEENNAMATSKIHAELFKKAYERLSAQLDSDEKMLFWKDEGAFSMKAKAGTAITNKSVFFVTKRNISKLPIKDVSSITRNLVVNSWYFNNNSSFSIIDVGCTDKQLGIMLGFICQVAKDSNDEKYVITIKKQ